MKEYKINAYDNLNQGRELYYNTHPTKCPHCHTIVTPKSMSASIINDKLSIVFRCNYDNCFEMFTGYYLKVKHTNPNKPYFEFEKVSRGEAKVESFSKEINSISEEFIKIYNQASKDEQYELDLIAGMGYRKALEFLIKDYLISIDKSKELEIKNKYLGNCINEDVSDIKLKEVAKRATWLGNDETHYVR